MCTAIITLLTALGMLVFGRKRVAAALSRMRCPFACFSKSPPSPLNPAPPGDPGLGWQERFIDGSEAAEEEYLEEAAEKINQVQDENKRRSRSKQYRHAFHSKTLAGIKNAELVVGEDIPEKLEVGFLRRGRKYRTTVRLSNASGKIQSDKKKDLRGIAARVHTDEGDQDFLATNGSASHARDVRQFVEFALALAGPLLMLLPRLLWNIGLFETFRMFRTVLRQTSRKVLSLACETYFSRSPYAIGERAVRFQFTPRTHDAIPVRDSDEYLSEELIEQLKRGPVIFDLQVQLYIDELKTPIEDGSAEWDSPLITIAQLVIPQQDLTTAEARADQDAVNELEFTPWNCLPGFRPLGSLNRGRRPCYRVSADLRKGRSKLKRRRSRKASGSPQRGNDHMSESHAKDGAGRCPFRPSDKPANEDAGQYRPKSSREGIGPYKYVYWNFFHFVFAFLDRLLAFNPFRKVSWDKWPSQFGLLFLLGKIRSNRSNALTDPYDYKTNDTKKFGPEPENAGKYISADGTYVSDNDNPQMGAENTRFGSNIPPQKVRPDVATMKPLAREVGKLRWRRIDPNTGKEITVFAMILNDLAGWWIQFQFHGFGGNTKRDPVTTCPHMMPRTAEDNWPDGDHAVVDRTTKDPTRVTDNGRPTPINERVQAWVQGQLYGTNETELNRLRSFQGGKFRLDENGNLPESDEKGGIDLTGFMNNYNPGLSFLHWLFVQEHNAIADYYASFHPDWDDEKLFQMARKVNVAQIARIHTIQWTEDLLQHPTLQLGMHADWYGFLGQKLKMWIMRLCHRYPLVEWLTRPLRGSDVLWGMPGSKWEHHDGPFQVPKHFRVVYRLHELVLSDHEMVDPTTNQVLETIDLVKFVHENTRPIVAKFGYETLAWSFVRKSCGALTLHNFPRALTRFQNQQDGTWTDLAERDVFREREDGTGTFNQFRMSLGERPVTSFMELTGGNAELARELEICYEGDIDKVDVGIGILAEPKPEGFALGFTQFYQFVLNAPRRVKSNRYLTEGFTYADYEEGMNWVEHGGGMLGAMYRHLPKLRPLMEGVNRAFAPWKDTEDFPYRMLDNAHQATQKAGLSDLRTLGLGAVAAAIGVCTGAVSLWFAILLLVAITIIPAWLTVKRMLAMRFLQLVWRKCYTDKRTEMFATLARAERSMDRASHYGSLHALAVMVGAAALLVTFGFSHWLVGLPLAGIILSAMGTRKWSRAYAQATQLAKIGLLNRMRDGQPVTDAATLLPGKTALEKRYWFLTGSEGNPVATYSTMYRALRENGLPRWKACGTAIMSGLSFGPKSQEGLSTAVRARLGMFDIYIPNLIKCQGLSNTRIYAPPGNPKGLTPGEVDMDEFELMFRKFAPGRDYMTAYDLERMREENSYRDACEGRGNWFTRWLGRMAAKRRHDQLMMTFEDRVVEEDKKLVPAISKDMFLRFYQGSAQFDLQREYTESDTAN